MDARFHSPSMLNVTTPYALRTGMHGALRPPASRSAGDDAAPPSGMPGDKSGIAAAQAALLRRRIGELSGTVFYTTLIKEMEKSTFRTKLMHGGRGEEVFRGQLALELGKSIGGAANDPVAQRLYSAAKRQLTRAAPAGEKRA